MPEMENKPVTAKKLRYGILCNGYTFKKWQVRVIENLSNSGKAEICLLIINSGPDHKKSFARKLKSIFEYDFLFKMFYRFLFWPTSLDEIDLSKKFIHTPYIECKVMQKGRFSEYFSPQDIDRIKEYKPDFLLRFGFNILRGDILDCTPYGIWSYHHGDEKKYRGTPAGFWEIYRKDNISGAILQRLTDKLDAGIVLRKAYFRTVHHSYSGNTEMLYYGCTHWPAQVCKDILNDTSAFFSESPSATDAPVLLVPSNLQMIIFILRLWRNKFRFHFDELFRTEHWNVGLVHRSIDSIAKSPLQENEIHWLPQQKKHLFRADGFAFADDENIHLFYEHYDFRKKKGHIASAMYAKDQGFSAEVPHIEKKFHLAYPYIFSHNNIKYCLPEASKSNKVKLYKFDKEQMGFVFEKTLLDKVDAVDPTLVEHENKWWLFFTRSGRDSNTSLYIYFAESFEGPFVPHSNNPVKMDIRSSRPAGTPYMIDDTLYRPAQNSSSTYGGNITINKVVRLSATEFREEYAGEVTPPKESRFNAGIHTLSSVGDYTVIDAKKHIFVFAAFRNQLARKINKLLRLG